jgi:hypothetical protein
MRIACRLFSHSQSAVTPTSYPIPVLYRRFGSQGACAGPGWALTAPQQPPRVRGAQRVTTVGNPRPPMRLRRVLAEQRRCRAPTLRVLSGVQEPKSRKRRGLRGILGPLSACRKRCGQGEQSDNGDGRYELHRALLRCNAPAATPPRSCCIIAYELISPSLPKIRGSAAVIVTVDCFGLLSARQTNTATGLRRSHALLPS